jgi:hypothetical protein
MEKVRLHLTRNKARNLSFLVFASANVARTPLPQLAGSTEMTDSSVLVGPAYGVLSRW